MIVLKNSRELALMRQAGKIAAEALKLAGKLIRPGITTKEIDAQVKNFILSKGAVPSFLHYNGYPASLCISVNNEVIHGIPSQRELKNGDIVSIDVGAQHQGYHGDNAWTFPCGEISESAARLLKISRECLELGVQAAVSGNRTGDIGFAIQSHAEAAGFAVVRDYIGHGVGASLHEGPELPNFGTEHRGARLQEGMTIAIEPMINEKGVAVNLMPDHWTVTTASGSLSAHFEHTVAITKNGPVLLTEPPL